MKVFKLTSFDACNSYVVTADGKTAVVIDCGEAGVYQKVVNMNLKPVAVLLTHGHFDHVGGAGEFFNAGVPIYCGEKEKDFIFSKANRGIFGGVYIPDFEITATFADGEEAEFAGVKFKVLQTAGHTAGSVCYIAENNIFSGDTLFFGSIGRTDLPSGNYFDLEKSVKKLYALKGDYKIFCGHGEDTTLDYERKNNAFIRGEDA